LQQLGQERLGPGAAGGVHAGHPLLDDVAEVVGEPLVARLEAQPARDRLGRLLEPPGGELGLCLPQRQVRRPGAEVVPGRAVQPPARASSPLPAWACSSPLRMKTYAVSLWNRSASSGAAFTARRSSASVSSSLPACTAFSTRAAHTARRWWRRPASLGARPR